MEIMIYCSQCEEKLEIVTTSSFLRLEPKYVIYVNPCKNCIEQPVETSQAEHDPIDPPDENLKWGENDHAG